MEKSSHSIESQNEVAVKKCPLPWWKRIGFLGFMFFFIKGLGWIGIFSISYIWGPEALESIKTFFTNLF
ncbi:MAG: hypothetical protein QNK51_05470 [Chitinophagales bacterium]|tara:strand:+ start:451 stop:657 length:207 start_codon:yes stop_codon:yes gene_type:complete